MLLADNVLWLHSLPRFGSTLEVVSGLPLRSSSFLFMRFVEFFSVRFSLRRTLALSHLVPVAIVAIALAVTVASLARMIGVLEGIRSREIEALHQEGSLHRAVWHLDVAMRKAERICRGSGGTDAAHQIVSASTDQLAAVLRQAPSQVLPMHELALGWLNAAEHALARDLCGGLRDLDNHERRVELDVRTTDLFTDRLTVLHASLEEQEERARSIGSRAVWVGILLALGSFGVAMLLATWLARSVNVPLANLAKTAREVGRGEFRDHGKVLGPIEVVELAEEIRRMQKRLAELDSLKQGFLASVSHEVRTPLSEMREGLAILEDGIAGDLEPRQLRVIRIVRSACERQIRLVATLLDLSRLRSGSPLRFEEGVSLDSLIDVAASAELRDRSVADVRIQVDRSYEIPLLLADPVLLERAIANLLRNSIAVSPKGATVRLERRTVQRDQGLFVRLTVSDQGPGVPEAIRETVFNAFVTSAVPRSPKAIGIGLGLAFAREVAVAHGGDLELDAASQSGATFHLLIPMKPQIHPQNQPEDLPDERHDQDS